MFVVLIFIYNIIEIIKKLYRYQLNGSLDACINYVIMLADDMPCSVKHLTTFINKHLIDRQGKETIIVQTKGNDYEFESRKDLLELMTCGHRNILQFHGVCVDQDSWRICS